jgi:hypothetical protein
VRRSEETAVDDVTIPQPRIVVATEKSNIQERVVPLEPRGLGAADK